MIVHERTFQLVSGGSSRPWPSSATRSEPGRPWLAANRAGESARLAFGEFPLTLIEKKR
jgi:hypothetical protein